MVDRRRPSFVVGHLRPPPAITARPRRRSSTTYVARVYPLSGFSSEPRRSSFVFSQTRTDVNAQSFISSGVSRHRRPLELSPFRSLFLHLLLTLLRVLPNTPSLKSITHDSTAKTDVLPVDNIRSIRELLVLPVSFSFLLFVSLSFLRPSFVISIRPSFVLRSSVTRHPVLLSPSNFRLSSSVRPCVPCPSVTRPLTYIARRPLSPEPPIDYNLSCDYDGHPNSSVRKVRVSEQACARGRHQQVNIGDTFF